MFRKCMFSLTFGSHFAIKSSEAEYNSGWKHTENHFLYSFDLRVME